MSGGADAKIIAEIERRRAERQRNARQTQLPGGGLPSPLVQPGARRRQQQAETENDRRQRQENVRLEEQHRRRRQAKARKKYRRRRQAEAREQYINKYIYLFDENPDPYGDPYGSRENIMRQHQQRMELIYSMPQAERPAAEAREADRVAHILRQYRQRMELIMQNPNPFENPDADEEYDPYSFGFADEVAEASRRATVVSSC